MGDSNNRFNVQLHVFDNKNEQRVRSPTFGFEIPINSERLPPENPLIAGYQIIERTCNLFVFLAYHVSIITTPWQLIIDGRAQAVIKYNYSTILKMIKAFNEKNGWTPSGNSVSFAKGSKNQHHHDIPTDTKVVNQQFTSSLRFIIQNDNDDAKIDDLQDVKTQLLQFVSTNPPERKTESLYASLLMALVDHIVEIFRMCDDLTKMGY